MSEGEEGAEYEDGEYPHLDENGQPIDDDEYYQQQYVNGQYEEGGEEGEYEEEEGEDGMEMEGQEDENQQLNSERRSNQMSPTNQQDSYANDEGDKQEQMRQIQRDIVENLNATRQDKKLPNLNTDLMATLVAQKYANLLLYKQRHDQNEFKKCWDERYEIKDIRDNKDKEKNQFGDHSIVHIISKYEEDAILTPTLRHEYFMEMGYLLLEDENDRKTLLSPDANHIGIGIAEDDDDDNKQVVIVFLISRKDLCVYKVEDAPDNVVHVYGKMLSETVGIYALQILPLPSDKPFDRNDTQIVGPELIEFDKQNRTFKAKVKGQCAQDPYYCIDLYTRSNPDSIPYKKPTREKIKLKDYSLQLRIPVMQYPDPRYAHEEELARKKIEEQLNIQQSPQQQLDDSQKSDNKSNMSDLSEKDDDQPRMDSDAFISKKFEIPKEQQLSNKEIREELEIAIAEAQRQHDELYDQNLNLQAKIKLIRNRQEVYVDKTGEMTMNEHKYLNTLAHVHQIRLDLQQTQDRYNKMAQELQEKLQDKQKKCNEIKQAFMELKREVARKAAYSRTDKPIAEKKIIEWEDYEMRKNEELQKLRLDTLRLKNTLAKNQKQLKKKEELAEGLHLIDFEQLKIENQTLNEKIEERTEDLHKLKNKNTKTVQILTHTREKLGFVKAKFLSLEGTNADKKSELDALRENLGKLKFSKDSLRTGNLKLKQQTGIVNRPELIQDYVTRKQRIEQLKQEQQQLDDKLRFMQQAIEKYNMFIKSQQQRDGKSKMKQI